MSLKYSSTTADYLIWSDAMNLIRKLAKDGNYKISLLIALGCFTGLRISDILSLRWKQILGTDEFTVIEKKDRQGKDYQTKPTITGAYQRVLQAYKSCWNQCANPYKSERHYLHSSENQYHS